jgi:hypothetical protein
VLVKRTSKPERPFAMNVYLHTKASGKPLWLAYSASRSSRASDNYVGTYTVQASYWLEAGNKAIALAKAGVPGALPKEKP